jgi:hypothetical protein
MSEKLRKKQKEGLNALGEIHDAVLWTQESVESRALQMF